jgi:alpha-N-arabinofuranosidase
VKLHNNADTGRGRGLRRLWLVAGLAAAQSVRGQGDLSIYTDQLVNGFQNWGWATLNYANTTPVHTGSDSISVAITGPNQAIQIYHPDMDDSLYASISFWLNGGASGGQQLQVYGLLHADGSPNSGTGPRYPLGPLPANSFQQFTVPLSALGVANHSNFTGFVIQDRLGAAQPTFYVDDIQLNAVPVPSVTHLTVNAGQRLRAVDARWFGLNTAVWDGNLDTPETISVLQNMGTLALRFPGGSSSDEYHWSWNRSLNNTWTWSESTATFARVATNVGAQVVITINYGTGTTNEAAAWVAWANGSPTNTRSLGVDARGTNWLSVGYWASVRTGAPLAIDDGRNFLRISRPAPLGFKYWEIGNENYGSWETDSNAVPHDPYTYALQARDFVSLMKMADPTARIGMVGTPGEDSFANNTNHPALNPRTGQRHNGWTPVLLATLKSLGVTPHFLIHHRYAQNPPDENDSVLLQSSSSWPADAADLRQQLTDYLGSPSTNVELVCTENNSVSYNPGKQTTSLVNGLFLTDSLCQLMKTEFNGLFWWDLRNGQSPNNNNSSSLYGWRLYGDYGVVNGLSDPYPTYYMNRLLQHFARPGDTVLGTATDYPLLAIYAVRRVGGAVALLVINKDPLASLVGQVALSNFTPSGNGTIYSYGIPQDNAAQTGIGSPDIAQTNLSVVGASFSYAFPAYSVTVLVLAPAPPVLVVLPQSTSSQFVFQLRGQPGVPYVLQSSRDLVAWSSVVTNTLTGSSMNFTNPVTGGATREFWRALWQP